MKLRLALVLLSVFLSLAISADRNSNSCPDAWVSNAPQTFNNSLGVNIHFTDARPGEIKMIADAGFRWVRMDFKWDVTERERSRYDFSEYDRLLGSLDTFKIHALLILDYGNPLYDSGAPPRTDAARQAFARWAATAAKHFAGRSVIWELYNEPNLATFWPPRPNVDEYIALALVVGRAFRTDAPNEKLIGPATSGFDFPFLEACFKAGLLDYWSAVSVHPYLRTEPEAAANDYCRLRKLIDRYHPRVRTRSDSDGQSPTNSSLSNSGIPIVSSEWGYSSVWRNLSEEKQGELLAREMLTNVANGIPISIWYDWRDDGVDPNDPEHHFGLVHNAYQTNKSLPTGLAAGWAVEQVYQPKPAYLAAKTLAETLLGYKFQQRLPIGDDSDYVLVFVNGQGLRIAAWTTSPGARRLVIPSVAGQFHITTHTGERVGSLQSGSQGLELTLSNAPIYLTREAP